MIKIDHVTGQLPNCGTGGKSLEARVPGQSVPDSVTISEEGKKRHILGQLMANISGSPGSKRRIDK